MFLIGKLLLRNVQVMLLSRYFFLLSAILALVATALFLPGLGGGFIFDDMPNIVENTTLHLSAVNLQDLPYAAYSFQPGKGSRALAMISFAVDYWRGGLDASVFKATNLVIHALTTLALAFFFRLLLLLADWPERRAALGALLLAAFWAIHPLQVSSVLYVVQRMQTLVTLFMVLAMWSYLKMRKAQIDGERSRHFGLLVLLFWALGFASKEDAALLPLYTLGIELTVLNFRATDQALSNIWRKLYLGLVVLGAVAFFLFIVPKYWSWSAYPGRSFSSVERLLTQGWVLLMYLGQIFIALPSTMPFYYDHLEISRSLWSPWYTLPAWLLIVALLILAWKARHKQPLMAFGVWVFFAGHFMTSNVINLEIAFEHRNHLPLIGAVLVFLEGCRYFCARYAIRPQLAVLGVCAIFASLVSGTSVRAYAWGEPLRFAQRGAQTAPHSARAWLELCTTYFQLSKQDTSSPYLDQAIETCQQGAELTQAPALLSNVVIFKTIKGSVTQADWDHFLQNLERAPMSPQNRKTLWVMLNNVDRKIPLDESGMLRTIDAVTRRATFAPNEYLRLGAYIFNETHEPHRAFAFLQRATELSPPDDPAITKMLKELTEAGRQDWVERLQGARKMNVPS